MGYGVLDWYGVWGIGYGYTHHIANMYKGLDGCYISQFPVKE